MPILQTQAERIRQLLPVLLRRSESPRSIAPETTTVELLKSPDQTPQTPVQRTLVLALKNSGSVSLSALVSRVSRELYREELHHGAAALDIGLFGDRLFRRDVLRELDAGNGTFWKIETNREVRP
jgi:hypothetical protein